MYYFAEQDQKWIPCRAKSLTGAKRAAMRRGIFQNVVLHIGRKLGQGHSERIERVAVRRYGYWVNV